MSKIRQIDLLKQLYFDNYNVMLRYGLKLVGDEAMVKDGIQKLFLELYEKKPNLSNHPNPNGYIIKSFRRTLLRTKKTYFQKGENFPFLDQDFDRSPEQIWVDKEEIQAEKSSIVTLLNSLSQRQKEIIYLHFFEEKTYREIADILDINYQSVLNNMQRAFRKIRLRYPDGFP